MDGWEGEEELDEVVRVARVRLGGRPASDSVSLGSGDSWHGC
jgi:hypothetical protein